MKHSMYEATMTEESARGMYGLHEVDAEMQTNISRSILNATSTLLSDSRCYIRCSVSS